MTEQKKSMFIDGREVEFTNERNILEVCRKAGIDIPTFCYQPELSVFGACRLCLVEIEGRGINSSCSTPAENGLKIKTNTEEIRRLRKMTMELLLASHPYDCLKCGKNTKCKLQAIARKVGVTLAERAKAKGIENVVFDRGGYIYHGRVQELAEGAREGGLEF